MRLARLWLADILYSGVEALASFAEETKARRGSLPRVLLALAGMRLAWRLIAVGDRIAPELTEGRRQ